jgi:hypothetical protein
MVTAKRGGGPKTEQGKARSAKNATTHGLTSSLPKNTSEAELIESFSKELIDYYQPQSPLEKLQIGRIATCNAKLQYLYEIERVKLALAAKELEAQPEKILEKIPGIEGVQKAMVLELIEYGQIQLPCKLDLNLLQHICLEISQATGEFDNASQFARSLPVFTKYLNSFPVAGLNDTNQWMEKLSSIAKRLETLLSFGDLYFGRTEDLIYYYGLGKDYEREKEREAMKEGLNELDRYQEEVVRPRLNLKPRPAEIEQPKQFEMPSKEVLKNQLDCFVLLYRNYEQANKLYLQYQEIRDLMVKSISLAPSESDLLLRYQTTLERRLSSVIGELLVLQKRTA